MPPREDEKGGGDFMTNEEDMGVAVMEAA